MKIKYDTLETGFIQLGWLLTHCTTKATLELLILLLPSPPHHAWKDNSSVIFLNTCEANHIRMLKTLHTESTALGMVRLQPVVMRSLQKASSMEKSVRLVGTKGMIKLIASPRWV